MKTQMSKRHGCYTGFPNVKSAWRSWFCRTFQETIWIVESYWLSKSPQTYCKSLLYIWLNKCFIYVIYIYINTQKNRLPLGRWLLIRMGLYRENCLTRGHAAWGNARLSAETAGNEAPAQCSLAAPCQMFWRSYRSIANMMRWWSWWKICQNCLYI